MSLTRKDWVELWEDMKVLQNHLDVHKVNNRVTAHIIHRTKEKIQQVIGQQE